MPALSPAQARILLYLCGGLLSALVDIGLLQLLRAGGVGLYVATSLGFCAGLIVNYRFHAHITFKRAPGARSFGRYLCVVALNYGVTLACVALSVGWFADPLLGKLLSLPLIAVIGYLLSQLWIFR